MTGFLPRKIAGLLIPAFALRHSEDFGIGDTIAVRNAIDFCREHEFAVLQTLPIHETIGDPSPYNPVTSRGLAPALLALTPDDVPGLTNELLEQTAPLGRRLALREGNVRHGAVEALKLEILFGAFRGFSQGADRQQQREFEKFQGANADWLPTYTLYRLLVRKYKGNPSWQEWRSEGRSPGSAERWYENDPDHEELAHLRRGFAFIQWVGWRQWSALRDYATERQVMLMGEIPFGVSRHSADVWARPELFDLEWNMGTPPLAYFDTNQDSARFGQNWGFPPYRWENHRADNFSWLRQRLRSVAEFFHICRLDHLRGYFRAYLFPWSGGARHAEFSQLAEEEIRQRTKGRWPQFVPGSDENEESARRMRGRDAKSFP